MEVLQIRTNRRTLATRSNIHDDFSQEQQGTVSKYGFEMLQPTAITCPLTTMLPHQITNQNYINKSVKLAKEQNKQH